VQSEDARHLYDVQVRRDGPAHGRHDRAGEGELGADLPPALPAAATAQRGMELSDRHPDGQKDVEETAEAGPGQSRVVHQ